MIERYSSKNSKCVLPAGYCCGIEFQEVSRVIAGQQQVDPPIDPPGVVRSQFETEICLRWKLFEIGFDFFKFAESTTAFPYCGLQVEFP